MEESQQNNITEENTIDKRKFNGSLIWIALGLITLCLIGVGYIYFQLKSDTGKCIVSPIQYGISEIEDSNGNNKLTCICTMNSPGNPSIRITRDNITSLSESSTSYNWIVENKNG